MKIKSFKIGLLPQVIIAIILGILCGHFFPLWLTRIFMTFNSLFSEFLGFIVPLLIVGLVAPAIADMGKNAGRMLLITTAIAYGSTLFAGFLSYFTGITFFPALIGEPTSMAAIDSSLDALPYFTLHIPPLMSVMTSLFLAFLLGLGMTALKTHALKDICDEFKIIIMKTIQKVIIPLLPLFIFGIFLNITQAGQVSQILMLFIKIIGVIFILHILLLLIQYGIAALCVRKNPFRLLYNMLPAYFTALGTQSSAATIPVTLKQTLKNKVTPDVAEFVVPLCATIHISGSMLKITACALALMMMQGLPFNTGLFVHFICLLGIVMIAAPGVPGGAIMASISVLTSVLGFGDADIALMIALYIAMDNFGTACNVTGDGAIALIVDTIYKKKNVATEAVQVPAENEETPAE